jgi:hypothetical protein
VVDDVNHPMEGSPHLAAGPPRARLILLCTHPPDRAAAGAALDQFLATHAS